METPDPKEINVKEVFQVLRSARQVRACTAKVLLSHSLMCARLLQEISDSISRHGYRPQAPDMLAIRECIFGEWLSRSRASCLWRIIWTTSQFAELAKWPALELTAGGLGGWVLGSKLGRR